MAFGSLMMNRLFDIATLLKSMGSVVLTSVALLSRLVVGVVTVRVSVGH